MGTPVLIKELIDLCSEKLGKDLSEELLDEEKESVKEGTIILVSGKNILHLKGLNTVVNDNDVVSMFPPAGGG